ncbi:MAG: 30S ribosomal protein S16 [Rickettsiales bacterium]|nr:30S ribosomal protein S16 [Rickettsiales bacterium]
MSTKIRLARTGRRNLPSYHVVVADDRSPRDGKFIESVGYYNPTLGDDKKARFSVNSERIEYWLGVGAKPTDRVALLLNRAEVKGAEKFKPRIRNTTTKKKKTK